MSHIYRNYQTRKVCVSHTVTCNVHRGAISTVNRKIIKFPWTRQSWRGIGESSLIMTARRQSAAEWRIQMLISISSLLACVYAHAAIWYQWHRLWQRLSAWLVCAHTIHFPKSLLHDAFTDYLLTITAWSIWDVPIDDRLTCQSINVQSRKYRLSNGPYRRT